MTDDPTDIDALFESDEVTTTSNIDAHRARLDAICDANIKLLFRDGVILAPEDWPEREALAIQRFTFHEKAGVTQVTLQDRSRALESRARLDELFKPKKAQADHPMIALFKRVPRDDMRQIIHYLDMLDARANSA